MWRNLARMPGQDRAGRVLLVQAAERFPAVQIGGDNEGSQAVATVAGDVPPSTVSHLDVARQEQDQEDDQN